MEVEPPDAQPVSVQPLNGQDSRSAWRRRLWAAYLSVLLCWGVCAYLEMNTLMQEGKMFAFTDRGNIFISDFVNVYNAALLAKACSQRDVNVYDPQEQLQSQRKLLGPVSVEKPFYMHYPPWFFTLVTPLSSLRLHTAWLTWCLLGLALCGLGLHTLLSFTAGGAFTTAFLGIAFLSSYPTWLNVKLGQTSLFLLPLMVTVWSRLYGKRYLLSGAVTAMCMFKFQHVPLVALSGTVIGRVKYIAGFCAAGIAGILLSAWQLGWHNILDYPKVLVHAEAGAPGVSAIEMQNVRGELVLLLGNDGTMVLFASVVIMLIALLVNTAMWWHFRARAQTDKRLFMVCVSISTLLLLVASPHSHIQDYLLMVIPCLWLWELLDKEPSNAEVQWLRFLILSFPVLSWIFFLSHTYLRQLYIQPYFIWAVAVMALSFRIFRADLLAGGNSPAPDQHSDDAG